MQIKKYEFIVNTIIDILGNDVRIFLFGSRATGKSRKFSDVDIAIDAGHKLEADKLIKIKSILEESSYPYKIDVLDLNNKPDYFDIGYHKQLYPCS